MRVSFFLSALAVLPFGLASTIDPAITRSLHRSSSIPQSNVSFTCQVMRNAFGNETVTSSDGDVYTDLEDINYSVSCRLPAACIVSPKNTSEVARAITLINKLNTTFAVRSGGHKYAPGFGGVGESGVLVSLANLTTLSLSADQSTIAVGPGNRWTAVYTALAPYNLTAIGGRVGNVGVGGFLLGGGVSYFSNEYGLGMHSVKSYEVVLGSGEIVTASASENSELFHALRGGGTNFGIVTQYELHTYPLGEFYCEARQYTLNQTDDFFNAFAAYQETGQINDPSSSVTVQVQSDAVLALMISTAHTSAYPSAFDAFYNITSYTEYVPPMNISLLELLSLTSSTLTTGDVRMYGETISHKVSASFMKEAYAIFVNETAALPSGATAAWVPAAISANTVKLGEENGGNLLGLSAVPQLWHEWYINWTDESQDEEVYAISYAITEKLEAAAKAADVYLPYLFMNTAGSNQKVLQSFGESNVATIKAAASKYDPDEVFQRLQNKGYLVRDL